MNGGRFLGPLSRMLSPEQPARLVPKSSAAVAVIFSGSGEWERVLLIRRAEREGDPWSGQVAFPGGMVSPSDVSFEETARRETREEVGVDLSSSTGSFLGYMKEFKAESRDVVVVPSVFSVPSPPAVTPNSEVASYRWIALGSLTTKEARSTYLLRGERSDTPFPSFVRDGLVIWGLTERILTWVIGDGSHPKGAEV